MFRRSRLSACFRYAYLLSSSHSKLTVFKEESQIYIGTGEVKSRSGLQALPWALRTLVAFGTTGWNRLGRDIFAHITPDLVGGIQDSQQQLVVKQGLATLGYTLKRVNADEQMLRLHHPELVDKTFHPELQPSTGHYESWWDLKGIRHLSWSGPDAKLVVQAIAVVNGRMNEVEEQLEIHIAGGHPQGGYTGRLHSLYKIQLI